MNFSEKLIRLRKREGISQEELASYLEVSRQAVSRWECGETMPNVESLQALSKFFGVSIASEQEMVFILARSEAKKPIMKAIMAKAGIQSAAQSLVFSLPVGDIAGLRELEQPET